MPENELSGTLKGQNAAAGDGDDDDDDDCFDEAVSPVISISLTNEFTISLKQAPRL